MDKTKMQQVIKRIIQGIAIASTGGGIALGAGKANLVDVDFITIAAVVIFSVAFNAVYSIIRGLIEKV